MDLKEYESVKFALAEILRGVALRSLKDGQNGSPVFRELFARLAEDRFNVVVVGRFNRGKTSLMNALLETTRLPVGILPLTSVITTVSYGGGESATIEFNRRSIPERVPLDQMAEYITELGNPGNVRDVKTARIELPATLLRRGFHFIDTPGIGSAIAENTSTTHGFLPEADVVLLVTSCDSPLSEDEMRVIDIVRGYRRHLFFLINKADLVAEHEREKIVAHVRARIRSTGIADPEVFCVSATAEPAGELADFGHRLTRFLLQGKQREFLRIMCDRIMDAINVFSGDDAERRKLGEIAMRLGVRDIVERPAQRIEEHARFSACEICAKASSAVVSFLCTFQFELLASNEQRASLADAGGFCEAHAWQYELFAGPRGACIALAPVLESTAARLLETGTETPQNLRGSILSLSAHACPACRERSLAEQTTIDAAVRDLESGGKPDAYCLLHFRRVAAGLDSEIAVRRLVRSQADAFRCVAEDMHRYVVKFDGTRRYLMADEERDADKRGLALLAGSRAYNGIAVER